MGNADTKLHFRKAVVQLTSKTVPVDSSDTFWEQFWNDYATSVHDVFTLIPAAEIRALREEAPSNLATLCYKAVEKLVSASDIGCSTQQEQLQALNCVRILTRIIPYVFEDPEWRGFFWSNLPAKEDTVADDDDAEESCPLAHSLLYALCDLLFCPDFTISPNKKSGPDKHEDLQSIDSCEYIWEAGVGFSQSPAQNQSHYSNRKEILKLILTCFSQTIYLSSSDSPQPNRWIEIFTSSENRNVLPLFTSLLNTVCAYKPSGFGVPYNHLLFSNQLEPLVEVALQILITSLDQDLPQNLESQEASNSDNLFVFYLSRIHREDDFQFILKGFTCLLSNPLQQTYLPHSSRKISFHQELLVFFWKMCDYNKKFLFYVLKSSEVLEILVPILYHLNDARADQSRVGLMHIGVFILLLLSGERNFGVRLNKPYTASVPMDIPVFTGTHADLLVIVFHKIITTGHQRLQPLFDCLLTILVNVSPYIKTMSMVAATKLLHLLEAFSTPWFLYSAQHHHHLIFFLLETFNNIIQYQFDGNSNLIYTIIRKRQVFHSLANLPTDTGAINKSIHRKLTKDFMKQETNKQTQEMMEGSRPAQPAEPGTKTATLPAMPGIDKLTEKESAHPTSAQLQQLTLSARMGEASDVNNENEANVAEASSVQPDGEVHGLPGEPTPEIPQRPHAPKLKRTISSSVSSNNWTPTSEWVSSWKTKLPLQTIMRLLQVLVPQVEKICIDKGLTDESEILRFLQHGTLVGLLPVPHPILIRKYQANGGTATWFRTYMWGVIYLRNTDPPIWYDTNVKLFEIQRV